MPADVRRRWDPRGGVSEVMRPGQQMQRHDLRCRPQSGRLRARDLDRGARAPGRAARGGGVAFRRHGAQQPERPLHPFRRLDLFLRSLVRPHAGLRRGAPAPARLPRRLSRAARRRGAAAPGQPLHVRSAERPLLLARRAPALRQRHGAGEHSRVRGEARRIARLRANVRERPEIGPRARRPRRHEVRFLRQCLGHGARRGLGLCAERRSPRQGADTRARLQPALGRRRFAHAVRHRDPFGLCRQDQGRPAPGALHAPARRRLRAARRAHRPSPPAERRPAPPPMSARNCASIPRAAP